MATPATFIAILLATIGAVAARDLPEFLHICQTEDPKFEKCVMNSIQFLKPYLEKGVPDYNIPSIEPIKMDMVEASPMNSMKIQFTNVNINGVTNYKVTDMKMDLKTLVLYIDVNLPYVTVNATYNVDGKIFILPIKGSGPMYANFSNNFGRLDIIGDRRTENGVERFRINEIKVKLAFGTGYLKLNNLFGDAVLGDAINVAINSNLDLFMQNIIPPVEKGLSDTIREFADKIVEQFSFSQLLPNL